MLTVTRVLGGPGTSRLHHQVRFPSFLRVFLLILLVPSAPKRSKAEKAEPKKLDLTKVKLEKKTKPKPRPIAKRNTARKTTPPRASAPSKPLPPIETIEVDEDEVDELFLDSEPELPSSVSRVAPFLFRISAHVSPDLKNPQARQG